MKRFTRKDEFGNYIIGELNDLGFELEYDELNLVTESVNKLGKLEDLEEKLGMDLEKLQETVEKAKKYEEKETPCKPVRIYPPFGDNVPVKRYPKIFAKIRLDLERGD